MRSKPYCPACATMPQTLEIPVPGESMYTVDLQACAIHGARIVDILRLATAIYELRGPIK